MEELDPCCKNCLSDSRLTSKDGTHRQCVRVCAEVTIKECEKLRNGEL